MDNGASASSASGSSARRARPRSTGSPRSDRDRDGERDEEPSHGSGAVASSEEDEEEEEEEEEGDQLCCEGSKASSRPDSGGKVKRRSVEGPFGCGTAIGAVLRTERSLRFALGAIGPLIISFGYRSPLDTEKSMVPLSLSYLTAIFYCMFAALAPPQLSSVAITMGGGIAGLLLGCCMGSATFLASVAGGKTLGYLVFVLFVFLYAPLKTGPSQKLTNLPALMSLYSGTIIFIMSFPMTDPGLRVILPTQVVVQSAGSREDLQKELPAYMWQSAVGLYTAMMERCMPPDSNLPLSSKFCNDTVVHYQIPEGELQGAYMHVFMNPEVMRISVDGGFWLIRVLWTGTGTLGIIRPIMSIFFIATAFFSLSMMLPLPRVRTAYNVTRAELVKLIGGPLRGVFLAAEAATAASSGKLVPGSMMEELDDSTACLGPASKIAGFEPGWPPMGIRLLYILPALVNSVQRCGRAAAAVARDSKALAGDTAGRASAVRALRHARAVLQTAGLLLASMSHNGQDLVSVPGGHRDALRVTVRLLREVSGNLPETAWGWALRHGVVREALDIARQVATIANLRADSERTACGAGEGVLNVLVGMMVPLGLPFARVFRAVAGLPGCLLGKRNVGACEQYDFRTQVGMTVGLALLVAPAVWVPGFRTYGDSELVESTLNLAGRFCTWSCLGFIVCYGPTLEGTLHKAVMRAIGTILGTWVAWLGVCLCGEANRTGLTIWLLASYIAAVWPSAHPVNALLGFTPSWGYAAQLFTYTETIIVVEAVAGIGTVSSLVLSRLLGQLLGISVAVLCALAMWVRVSRVARSRVAAAFSCCAEAVWLLQDEMAKSPDNNLEMRLQQHLDEADSVLDDAQVALDDAAFSIKHFGAMGRRGCGLVEARACVADCSRAFALLGESGAWQQVAAAGGAPAGASIAADAQRAFHGAAARLRQGKRADNIHASSMRGGETSTSEAAWLLRQATLRAGTAGTLR